MPSARSPCMSGALLISLLGGQSAPHPRKDLSRATPAPTSATPTDGSGAATAAFDTGTGIEDARRCPRCQRARYRRVRNGHRLARRVSRATSWAIVDSNHGPPPYQSGALTD